jgi:hypothetical protein
MRRFSLCARLRDQTGRLGKVYTAIGAVKIPLPEMIQKCADDSTGLGSG